MTMAVKKTKKQTTPPSTDLAFIEELKTRWMATVDAIQDPLMIVDKNYNIIKSNRALADASNRDIKSLIGRKCFEVFAGRKQPCSNCRMPQVFADQKLVQFDLENAQHGRFHEVTAQPMPPSTNEESGVLTIYRDRTEAKELQDQLLQSEKMASIGLLAGGIAHEINNPLGGILIFSQMMLREMKQDNIHYSDVVEIEAAARRCKEIIQNLLEFARSQPISESEKNDVDIQQAILSALNFVMVGNNRREIKVIENWHDEKLTFRGSLNKVIQVFLNLIQNAVQAMPRGGVLTLSSSIKRRKNVDYVCYEVADTGVGIEPSKITKIFDPFYTSKDPGEGTGLGLSICHGIIKDMMGEIEVSSQVGEETNFRIYFPYKIAKKSSQSA